MTKVVMPNCVLPQKELYRRGTAVPKLLYPLVAGRTGPAWSAFSDGSSHVIAAFSGTKPVTRDYRDWRFATYVPTFYGMYFERWEPADMKHQSWYLERAYLSMFRLNRVAGIEKEILALHCDPNESDPTHLRFKRGPHLHLTVAEHPLPHAHIALELGATETLLGSVQEMSSAIGRAMDMLSQQVLDMYRQARHLPEITLAQ